MAAQKKVKTPKGTKVMKKTKAFRRFQSDRFMRVSESWRKPKGIDNRVRRRFSGSVLMPSIGYGTDKRFKYMMKDGLKAFRVTNVDDLEMLVMHSDRLSALIHHAVGAKKRKLIIDRAHQLGVKVINKFGRLHRDENE